MKLTGEEQYRRADLIIDAVCKVGGITYFDLIASSRSLEINILRGLCCFVSWDYGVHARILSRLIHRSRANIINQSNRYRSYLVSRDKEIIPIYEKIKDELKYMDNGKI